jgi:chromosome segregation ATPase
LKGKQFQNETFKLKSEAKILERELDQSINSYNDVLASNKNLKIEIDELRKEKLNQKDVMKKLTSKIEEYKKLIDSARKNI